MSRRPAQCEYLCFSVTRCIPKTGHHHSWRKWASDLCTAERRAVGCLPTTPSDLFPAIAACRSHTRKVRAGF
jgi:hypothetical protein